MTSLTWTQWQLPLPPITLRRIPSGSPSPLDPESRGPPLPQGPEGEGDVKAITPELLPHWPALAALPRHPAPGTGPTEDVEAITPEPLLHWPALAALPQHPAPGTGATAA